MASYPAQRTVRAALAATAVVALLGGLPLPQAEAQPNTASDALKEYERLSSEAEKLNEEHLRAQDDLKAAQDALTKANSDLTTAQQAQDQFRGQVDLFTEATFEGARFNHLSALLVADSQQDYLNRLTALDVLAGENAEVLDGLSKAVALAVDAQGRANTAAGDAAKAIDDVTARGAVLDQQITQARDQYRRLSGSERALLGDAGYTGPVAVPPGTAGQALAFALNERGKPYVYGANGPDEWDCSSLMQAAYRSVGISIPRTTYGQATIGRAVSRNDVKAGDLIIYYAGRTHVAMAIDGIRAVHASTEGVPVRIQDIESIGPVDVIRRVVG